MARKRLFTTGFGPRAEPDPHDVASIGTQLALANGTRAGLEQKATGEIIAGLAGPAALADTLAETLGEKLDNEIGEAQTVANAVVGKAQGRFMQGVITPTESAVRLGWVPAGAPGTGARGRSGRRLQRRATPDPAAEQPPSLSAGTGDPAGAPGAAGPPTVRADTAGRLQAVGAAALGIVGQATPGTSAPAGNEGGVPPDGGGAPQAGPPQFTGATGPGYEGPGPHGATAQLGYPAGTVGAGLPGPPAGPAGPEGQFPPLGPLPGPPAGPAGGFPGLGPANAPQGQPGPGNGAPLWFLPFPAVPGGVLPSLGPGGPFFVPPFPGGPGGVTPPFPGGGPAVPPILPSGVGGVPPFGPAYPAGPGGPPAVGGGPPVGPGGSAEGGGGGGGGPGGPAVVGPGGPQLGPGGPGYVGPPIIVQAAPPAVNLSCPAPVVQLQCPACGAVGLAQPPVVVAPPAPPQPLTIQEVLPGPGAPVTVNVPVNVTGPAAGGGPTVNFSPLFSPELVLGQTPPPPPPPPPTPEQAQLAKEIFAEIALLKGEVLREEATACLPGAEAIKQVAGKSVFQMLRDAGHIDDQGNLLWVEAAAKWIDANGGVLKGALEAVVAAAGHWEKALVSAAQWVQAKAPSISGCDGPDVATAWVVQIVLGLIRHWVADLPESLTYDWDTYTRWACPIAIPSQAEANECFSRGTINQQDWECLTRSNGNNQRWQMPILAAMNDWPSIDQTIMLERRGLLNPDQAALFFRRNRVPNKALANWHRRAADFTPTVTDAVEWMGKDLGDPLLTGTFGLFNEFRQKYFGPVKEAFRLNAIDEKWARLVFAAHRKPVSPHQLYEMHKRLRPGWWARLSDADAVETARAIAPRRPSGEGGLLEQASSLEFLGQQRALNALYGSDPDAVARFGKKVFTRPVQSPDPNISVPGDLTGLPPLWLDEIGDNPEAARAFLAETVTSGFHVFEGLSQANYPPFWRARLTALSYNVLTRVDIRRAYETGQISQEVVNDKLQDRGYTPTDGRVLAGQWREAAVQLHTRRPAANQWVSTGYDAALLKQALQDQGMRPDMWDEVYKRLQVRRAIYVQQRCIAQLKRQVIAGLVEEAAVAPRLVAVGLTGPEAARLAKEWACEKRAIPKPESASQVCEQLQMQLIGPEHAVRLIHQAGYSWIRARRIVNACLLKPVRKGQGKRADLPGKLAAARAAAPPEEREQIPLGPAAGAALGPAGLAGAAGQLGQAGQGPPQGGQ